MQNEKVTPTETKRPVGRPKGSTNSKSRAFARKIAEDEENCPLAVMVRVMKELLAESEAIDPAKVDGDKAKDEATKERRRLRMQACEIAKDAAPFIHARLQSVAVHGSDDEPPIQTENVELTREQYLAELMARGLPVPNIEA